jgi:HD-GYP domain-containing protein (c-di-GMP phosphodiesterase class II)
LASRIIAVAEAFDMMHSQRPHRKALALAECRRRLLGGGGTQFDPQVVSVMMSLVSRELVATANRSAADHFHGHSAGTGRRRAKP